MTGANQVHEDRRTNRMRTVSAASAATEATAMAELPVSVQEALGEQVGAAKEGLLASASVSGSGCCTS